MSDRQASILPIKCPNCGQSGSVAWSAPDSGDEMAKSLKNLVKVSSRFHWEVGRGIPDQLFILCDRCDEIQP